MDSSEECAMSTISARRKGKNAERLVMLGATTRKIVARGRTLYEDRAYKQRFQAEVEGRNYCTESIARNEETVARPRLHISMLTILTLVFIFRGRPDLVLSMFKVPIRRKTRYIKHS